MKEFIEKYREWYKNTPKKWKLAVIEKAKKDNIMYIDDHQDIDWLYDDCVDYLTFNSTRRLTNLANKMGYKEIPCPICKKMIKHWKDNDEWKWSPDTAHLFPKK